MANAIAGFKKAAEAVAATKMPTKNDVA